MKAIFLDVDGVLNCDTSISYCGIYIGADTDKIKRIARIINETKIEESETKVILSSDWRYDWDKDRTKRRKAGRYLDNKFWWRGKIKIYDKTPNINPLWRGHEIAQYLIDHPEITEWVILDDNMFNDFYDNEYIKGHLIWTDYHVGLTDKEVEQAIKILNGEQIHYIEILEENKCSNIKYIFP